jgi:hypothetical protein
VVVGAVFLPNWESSSFFSTTRLPRMTAAVFSIFEFNKIVVENQVEFP